MKKQIFAFLIGVIFAFCAASESYEFVAVSELFAPKKDSGKDFRAKSILGFHANFPIFDFRVYEHFDNVSPEIPVWSASLSVFKKKMPLIVRVGNLSFSQVVSLFKSPAPSATLSPLKKSFSKKIGITSSLPSRTSTTKPISAFFSFQSAPDSDPFSFFFQVAAVDFAESSTKRNGYGTFGLKFPIANFSSYKVSFSLTFPSIENNSENMKKANADFSAEQKMAFIMENLFSSPFFDARFSMGVVQTPWRNSVSAVISKPKILQAKSRAFWILGDFRFSHRIFVVDFSAFFVPTYDFAPDAAVLIGSANSPLRKFFSAKINPQIALGNWHFGTGTLFDIRITDSKTPTRLTCGKFSSALEYSKKPFAAKLTVQASNIVFLGEANPPSSAPEKYFSSTLSTTYSFAQFKGNLNFSAKHYPARSEKSQKKEILKATLGFSPGKKRFVNAKTSAEITIKDGDFSALTWDTYASFKFTIKKIKISGKVAFEMKF